MTGSVRRHSPTAYFITLSVFFMATSFAHSVTPVLMAQLGLADYMFGLALAVMMASNFLFSPFWGRISGLLSNRVTMLVGCLGYAVGQVIFALARSGFMFLFARFFAGIFIGAAFVSFLIQIVDMAPDERLRGRYLVTYATLQAVFGSMGYFVGGMLGEIGVYWAVVAQAVTLAACGVALYIILPPGERRREARMSLLRLAREANPFQAFAQGRRFLTTTFSLLFAVCALQSLSQTGFDQTFNFYAIDQLGLSTGYNGLIKAVMGLVTLLANSTLCAWLMRRGNLRLSAPYVLLAATVCMACVLFVRDLAPFLALNVLFYALSAISIPMTQALVMGQDTAADRNLVMGFYNALKSFGGIVGALLAGFTYVISPLVPFLCCAAALALATVCGVLYSRRVTRGA